LDPIGQKAKMKNEELLLREMISALDCIGLNWKHIMEDYIESQLEQGQMSIGDISELKTIMRKINQDIYLHTLKNSTKGL
jgi:hypothetical protein